MYRKPGSQSALSGVLSGPYTGGRHTVDASRLEVATRKRVADAIAGHGDAAPIAYERHAGITPSGRAFWAIVFGLSCISLTFALGFDDPKSRYALQPLYLAPVYVIGGALFSFGVLALLRWRALLGSGALRPGRYLLALDIVDVSLPDAGGRQTLVLLPLGDARDVKVRSTGKKTELVLSFADATTASFVLRGDASGDVALRRLEHSQRLLEELTYVSEIGKAFAHDPFFDLRVDASWAAVAPDAEKATRSAWLFGRKAPIVAVAVALVLGGGTFGSRNAVGDRALFARAVHEHTPEAIDAYLARGGRMKEEAAIFRGILQAEREKAEREKAERDAREKALAEAKGSSLFVIGGPPSRGSKESCAQALEARANPAHPEVLRALRKIVLAEPSDPVIPVRFTLTKKAAPQAAENLEEHFAEREATFVRAFERVVSDVCSAQILRFVRGEPERTHALQVSYEVSWPARSVSPREMHVVFDVTFRGGGEKAEFRLTMPASVELPVQRPRSLFVIPGSIESGGAFDQRVFHTMTARAFDRLYDEIWSLFFQGNPRVPLRDDTLDVFGKPD